MSQDSAPAGDPYFDRPRPRDRARAVYKCFLQVRGFAVPVQFVESPAWDLTDWEQAIVDGRASAVVNHLLLQEVAELEFRSRNFSWRRGPGGSVVIQRHKRDEFETFDAVNHLINLNLVEFPDWTPALARYQSLHLVRPAVSPILGALVRSPTRLPLHRQHVIIPYSPRHSAPSSPRTDSGDSTQQSTGARTGGPGGRAGHGQDQPASAGSAAPGAPDATAAGHPP